MVRDVQAARKDLYFRQICKQNEYHLSVLTYHGKGISTVIGEYPD